MRSSSVFRLFAATLLLSVVTVTATAQRWLADISGKWTLILAGPDGAIESAVLFKQDADTLVTGTIENKMVAGQSKLMGTLKGDTLRFAYSIEVQGMTFELTASGMVKDKDNISGQLFAPNGMGSFPFTMKRAP